MGSAVWGAAGFAILFAGAAYAEPFDISRFCARGAAQMRLESVEQGRVGVSCTLDESGAPDTCDVLWAEPDNDAARFFALIPMCQMPDLGPAFTSSAPGQAPRLSYEASFSAVCEGRRGDALCATNELRMIPLRPQAQAAAPEMEPEPEMDAPPDDEDEADTFPWSSLRRGPGRR